MKTWSLSLDLMSRIQRYTRALRELLEERREDRIKEELDRIYAHEPSSLDPALAWLQTASLDRW